MVLLTHGPSIVEYLLSDKVELHLIVCQQPSSTFPNQCGKYPAFAINIILTHLATQPTSLIVRLCFSEHVRLSPPPSSVSLLLSSSISLPLSIHRVIKVQDRVIAVGIRGAEGAAPCTVLLIVLY